MSSEIKIVFLKIIRQINSFKFSLREPQHFLLCYMPSA